MEARRDILAALGLALTLAAGGCGPAGAQSAAAGVRPTAWKALLVAADDKEPVFSNAVDAIHQRLRSFGIAPANISVLKADARTRDAVATRANLEVQPRKLAGPASVGCFVFITSHGHPQGGLLVRGSNSLLLPQQLDHMLERGCADRPTVVVTSGCFSGIYTVDPAMRRPNRIILAAARADLPSFGCSVSERYSYYDGCFLVSLRRGLSWQVIANNVGTCVAETEKRRGNPPSHPQTFFGSKVAGLTAF